MTKRKNTAINQDLINADVDAAVAEHAARASAEAAAQALKDARNAAVEAGLLLATGAAISDKLKASKGKSVATLDRYFGALAIKFANAEVKTTKDKRKAGEVPALDKVLQADEVAMMQRVGQMTDEQLAEYGWTRETTLIKGRPVTEIKGYKTASTWTQYKSNLRTAIINGTAKRYAETDAPVPMARLMEENRDASKAAKLAEAIEGGDVWTIANDTLSKAVALLRDACSMPDKGEPDENCSKARHHAARYIAQFVGDVNRLAEMRAKAPIDTATLVELVSAEAKPMPVVPAAEHKTKAPRVRNVA